MLFAGQAADVPGVGKHTTDQPFAQRQRLAILPAACGARISASQKRSATRCADRALAKSIGTRNAPRHEFIEARGANVWSAQSGNRVEPLLVGADPEDIGWTVRRHP